jgi:hypothetical protein
MKRILAAVGAALATPFRARFGVRFGAIALLPIAVLILAGWRDAPVPPVVGSNPADPAAPAPRVDYRSTIAPYKSRRPIDPAPWGEQNQRVAPQPKSGQ